MALDRFLRGRVVLLGLCLSGRAARTRFAMLCREGVFRTKRSCAVGGLASRCPRAGSSPVAAGSDASAQALEPVGELPFGAAYQEPVVLAQGEAENLPEQIRVSGRRPVLIHPFHEAAGAQQEYLVDVGVSPAQRVDPMHGFGAGTLPEMVQVEAVDGANVVGAGGKFPPELGAEGAAGQVQHAAEEVGAVEVEICRQRLGGVVAVVA